MKNKLSDLTRVVLMMYLSKECGKFEELEDFYKTIKPIWDDLGFTKEECMDFWWDNKSKQI